MSCCSETGKTSGECCGGTKEHHAGGCCSDNSSILSPEEQLSELFVYKEVLEKELSKVNSLIEKISNE
ncbi:MAG: hypothetical protein PF637_12590 [Spirochaetes bacterium]|nr:hypothetical protein [Spirochaetota bacterium]